MGETRQFPTHLAEIIEIDLGADKSRPIGKYGNDLAPWIDDHRMAMSFKTLGIFAELIWRDHVNLIFNGARAQQRLPVRFSRVGGECRRNENQMSLALS